MSSLNSGKVEALRRIRSFAQVFKYLVDERGWPIDPNALDEDDFESLTYDWDPKELGISPDSLKSLRRLRQMRPVTANQPWGVFFLEFAGSRLPITQVRRILRGLVTRKRREGGDTLPSWKARDLLFIVITGATETVELHLVTFRGDGPQGGEIRSLTWRVDTPDAHLRRLAEELLPRLEWPDDPDDSEAWRTSWLEAFKLPTGQAICDATRLADRMAHTARDLRDQIAEALHVEKGSGPFSKLLEEVRKSLMSDVNDDKFADMCAQTLTYGVLSSRVTDPEGFGSSPIFSSVPLANPFLEAFFEEVHDQAVALDLAGSGLPQLVADLRETNVEAILDQFGATTKGGDPVIHFYEEFLKRYDSKKRADAGAFYTPKPVVEFMVRMVDEVLRTRFDLPMGIADPATWQEVADRNGFSVPVRVDPRKPFVSMIDPATGTGTFLVEWLRRARKSFLAHGEEDYWPQHLRQHILPAMHAFENMLAPYSIAHLKVALEFHASGIGDAPVQVILTDALDHRPAQGQFASMSDPVAEEGERAADLKENERFTVVIGNPPYDREQRSLGDSGRRKGGVVRHAVPGVACSPLINRITSPMKDADLGHHLKNVYNDYVYFWRWAIWQAIELPLGPGVVAFITASSYLDGVSMGGVRALFREVFDELWIVDLGGEGRGARKEENVFDILTPVAVAVGTKTYRNSAGEGKDRTVSECTVHYLRVTGSRIDKLTFLDTTGLDDVNLNVRNSGFDPLIPKGEGEYYQWPQITDVFPFAYSGCQVKRTWPIAETDVLLKQRWKRLLEAVPRQRAELLKETSHRDTATTPAPLLTSGDRLRSIGLIDRDNNPESIEPYGYRSFDRQRIIADNRVTDSPKPVLWRILGPRQIFLTSWTSTKLGRGPAVTVAPYVPDLHHFAGRYGAKNVLPLYRDQNSRIPNITQGLLDILGGKLGIKVSPEDLIAYVHALAGTGAFTERFDNELGEAAGPIRLPITADLMLFQRGGGSGPGTTLVAHLGRTLRSRRTDSIAARPSSADHSNRRDAGEVPLRRRYPATHGRNRHFRTCQSRGLAFRGLWPEGSEFLAWLSNEKPQGQKVQPSRLHPTYPLDADRRTSSPTSNPRTHRRSNPHRSRSAKRNPRRTSNPRL